MAQLQIEAGTRAGTFTAVDAPLSVGRGEQADLRLFDENASRLHARFAPADASDASDGLTVTDLNSRNGTWVNGRRLAAGAACALAHGDRVQIGSTVMRVLLAGAAEVETIAGLPPGRDAPSGVGDQALRVRSTIAPAAIRKLGDAAERSERLRDLFRLQSTLTREVALEPFLALAAEQLRALVPATTVAVGVYGERSALRLVRRAPAGGPALCIGTTLARRVAERGEALLLADLTSAVGHHQSLVTHGIVSAIGVPLSAGARTPDVLGLLYFDRRAADAEAHGSFAPDDLSFAVQIGEVLGPLLANVATFAQAGGAGTLDAYQLVGEAPALVACLRVVQKVAPTETPVLLSGETGTGKELFARAIHDHSGRRGPFVALNSAAIPSDLLESELFGHEQGAFTGAVRARPGKLELAADGTFLLDEVAELPLPLQAKLLRVLQDRRFYRVGGEAEQTSNFRLVCATNRDLKALVAAGRFREDLFYRVQVVHIELPPLRERLPDLPELARHFAAKHAARLGRPVLEVTDAALVALARYAWPGNVRELENVIERAVVLAEGQSIEPEQLPREIADPALAAEAQAALALRRFGDPASPGVAPSGLAAAWASGGFPEVLTIAEAERRAVVTALRATGGKKGEAAERLGVSWPTLRKKIRDYRIDLDAL